MAAALDEATPAQRRLLVADFTNVLMATDVPRGLLVVDDVHRVRDPALFGFVDELAERLPGHWGIVLASRSDPPLATLARLRARGEVAEFRQEDLRFDVDEVGALIAASPSPRAAPAAQQLWQRTQGWAAGLRLALDAKRTGGVLTERHVYNYLASEVLEAIPADERLFLMRCSVLPELTPERCAEVSGDARALQWLADIERQGLFVSVRGEGDELVLCLHDLLRECLDDLLRRERPEELPQLLRRAAASETDTVRRVGYLLRAHAWAEARAALWEAAPALLTIGAIGPVHHLLDQFPPSERESPQLDIVRGLAAWARWDFDTMRVTMQRAADNCARAGDVPGRQLAQAYLALALHGGFHGAAAAPLLDSLGREVLQGDALVAAQHALVWQAADRGNFDDIAPLYASELDTIEGEPDFALWYKAAPISSFIGAPGFQGVIARFVDGALATAPEGASGLRVVAMIMRAWLQMWCGRLDDAETLLAQADGDARWLGQSRAFMVQGRTASAFMHALRGDRVTAYAHLRESAGLLSQDPAGPRRDFFQWTYLFIELRLAAACGDSADVLSAAARLSRLTPQASTARAELLAADGYVAMAQGHVAEAVGVWRRALDAERQLRLLGTDLELRLRLAAALLQQGGDADTRAQAADVLRPALQRGARNREHAPALLVGPDVLERLAAHRWGSVLDSADVRLLADWRDMAERLRRPDTAVQIAAARGDDPGLTEREREVLARIAVGDSNKLIARAFDLSPHTVKRHVANILDKLGLQSRGQAAAWHRARS